jgi:hypothetical protein
LADSHFQALAASRLLSGGLRAASRIVSALDNPFALHMLSKAARPLIKRRQRRRLACESVRLVIRVQFSNSDVGMSPERVRNLDPAVLTLPNQALVGVALIVIRFVFWVEPLLMNEYLRSSFCIQVICAAIEVGPYQLIGPMKAHASAQARRAYKSRVPQKVGLMIAMGPIAIAGPDAQRHGRGNAGVAWLYIGLAMLIAQNL